MRQGRAFLVFLALLSSCGTRPLADLLPREVNGWTLSKSEAIAPGTLAPEVRERSPEQAVRAQYAGTQAVSLTLVRMQSETSAFALMQSWRRREGAQPFYRGDLFGFAEGADHKALIAFVRAFDRRLGR